MHYRIRLTNGSTVEFEGTDSFMYVATNQEDAYHFPKADGGTVVVRQYEMSWIVSSPVTEPDAQDAPGA
jgi:hypothetical protein